MSIKAQVLILPTDHSYGWDKNQLCKCIMEIHDHFEYRKGDLMISNHKYKGFTHFWQAQHLYLITNQPIKEGEWYYSMTFNRVIQALVDDLNGTPRRDFKIIASTDTSLNLPTIPLIWIRDIYVPSNGTINEVELEVNYYCKLGDALAACNRNCDCSNETQYLELTPTDEVVILNTPQAKALALTEELLPALQDINHPITKDEFMYQLKHVVPTNQRKEWAEQNKHRIIKAPVQTAIKMKKTVQIVTVPINKQGFWKIGDIMKSPSGDRIWLINNTNFGETLCFWQAQQLLVLSDDTIEMGDLYLDDKEEIRMSVVSADIKSYWDVRKDYKKIIAAYPIIEDILPLSKETIQQWIDNGTPGECTVEMQLMKSSMDVAYYFRIKDTLYTYTFDSQGNLILEFDKQHYEIDLDYSEEELTNEEAKEWCESIKQSYTPKEFLATLKTVPSENREKWVKDNKHLIVYTEASIIPTDVEIEEKAHDDYTYGFNMSIGSYDRHRYEEKKESYISGYKQALKDLGYEK